MEERTIDLDHCTILGSESVDANSLNRCMFNLHRKMVDATTRTVDSVSDNVPQSPFFSGGYDNILDVIEIGGSHPVSATSESVGLVPRLYRGSLDIFGSSDTSFTTESVSGTYTYSSNELSTFAPTVDALFNDSQPILKPVLTDDSSTLVTGASMLGTPTSPIVKHTSYMTCAKHGVSFGTITFNRNNGDRQYNVITLDILRDMVGMEGVETIDFITVGNGFESGVRTVSDGMVMVSDIGQCTVTYLTDGDIAITGITKSDDSDAIYVDKKSGRIVDDVEPSDYNKYVELSNDEFQLNFFILFTLKDEVLKYTDDLWCFYVVDDFATGRERYSNASGWARDYYKYSFDNFEAADDGVVGSDGSHEVDPAGCVKDASDAFNGCSNATFKSLWWFSPALRYADRMFKNCTHATFDSISSELYFEHMRSAISMFQGCADAHFGNIETISLPTASQCAMMFADCSNASFELLRTIDVAGNANRMFYGDFNADFQRLVEVTGNGTSFVSMFEGCDNATFDRLSYLESDKTGMRIDASRMFYGLTKPTFDGLSSIDFSRSDGIENVCGYDAVSMFEGCRNATFTELTSLGNVVDGTRMFFGLDPFKGDVEANLQYCTFSGLHSLGPMVRNGTSMFADNYHLNMTITDENCPVIDGTRMFQNTDRVLFTGNLPNLVTADEMMSHINSAEVRGDMESLVDGERMFMNDGEATVLGEMPNLKDANSMFYMSDVVKVAKFPATVADANNSFADVASSCEISAWEAAVNERYCNNTFYGSRNVSITGDVVAGKTVSTSHMFDSVSGLQIANVNISNTVSSEGKWYNVDFTSKYAFVQKFTADGEVDGGFMVVGGATPDNIGSLITESLSGEMLDAVAIFTLLGDKAMSFDVYTLSGSAEFDGISATLECSGLSFDNPDYTEVFEGADIDIIKVYRNDDTAVQGNPYGYLMKYVDTAKEDYRFGFRKYGEGIVEEMLADPKRHIDEWSFLAAEVFSDYNVDDDIGLPPVSGNSRLYTSFVNDDIDMGGNWRYADYMFYNVVQDKLLSGYFCLFDRSIEDSSYMFALSSPYASTDGTFDDSGPLFINMPNSKVKSMDAMFENRQVNYPVVFKNIDRSAMMDEGIYISFPIPYSVASAASAFHNCSISARYSDGNNEFTIEEIGLNIPSSLVNADHMFDGYGGPKIRFGHGSDGYVFINDDISCVDMFKGCQFVNDADDRFGISIPNIYLNMFGGSDFSMSAVTSIDVRNGLNFASPYSTDEFFNNDMKMLGCSSLSFDSLEMDVLDWFCTGNTAVEGAYLATVVAPTGDEYRIMTAEKDGGTWNTRFCSYNDFNDNIKSTLFNSTSGVHLNSIRELANEYGRMGCMFNLPILFDDEHGGTNHLGDGLGKVVGHNGILSTYEMYGKNDAYVGKTYNMTDFGRLERVDALEMPFAFSGCSSATFDSLSSIGPSVVMGYGAFMSCSSASFNKLEKVEFMQDGTVQPDTMDSRFTNDVIEDEWYGNYCSMFSGCSSATFDSLESISLDSRISTYGEGGSNRVVAWYESNREVAFTTVSGGGIHGLNYSVNTLMSENNTYTLMTTDSTNPSNTHTVDTGITIDDDVRMNVEMCELDAELLPLVTVTEPNGIEHVFLVNEDGSISALLKHPKDGVVESTGSEYISSTFASGGGYITGAEYTDMSGEAFGVDTYENGDGVYCLAIKAKGGVGMSDSVIATFSTSSFIVSGATPEPENMSFSIAPYISDGRKCVVVTIGPVDSADAVYFKLYDADTYEGSGTKFAIIEQMADTPTNEHEYRSLFKMDFGNDVSIGGICHCSGMFMKCSSANLSSLTTVVLPGTGSCSRMFSGCTSLGLSSIDTLILPTASVEDKEGMQTCYESIFEGVAVENIDLGRLSVGSTNIGHLGYDGYKTRGDILFGGMSVTIATSSDAVNYLNLPESIAVQMQWDEETD